MKEVIITNNITGLRIFINGVPDLMLIPNDEMNVVITALERQIAEFYESKHKKTVDK